MIVDWKNLDESKYSNLLLGNGFSIGISSKFNYSSLLDTFGSDSTIGRYSCTRDIFQQLETTDFEFVLRAMYHAYIVSIDNRDSIFSLYNNLKDTLISTICDVHPKYNEVPKNDISHELLKYKSIYTTNYDLILYWSILDGKTDSFIDYFWGNAGKFSPRDIDNWSNRISVYYIHGGIHLKSNMFGEAIKSPVNLNEVDAFYNNIMFKEQPLFITEGNYKLKKRNINQNEYLRFCYQQFESLQNGLTVYGHSLSKEYDFHLIEAIKCTDVDNIAISVYSGLKSEEKNLFMAKINDLFKERKKTIVFFESNSHPFANINT